jgi:hypothetical protein
MSTDPTPAAPGWPARVRGWMVADPGEPLLAGEARNLHRATTLALVLTLAGLLVGAPPNTHLLAPIVAVVGLAVPGALRNRWYWLFLAGLVAIAVRGRPWLELDNHHWLHLWWFVAIAVSRFAVRPDAVLRVSARMLVGLTFAFAVGWKLLAPEFLSGAFFDLSFVTDSRLADVAAALGQQGGDVAATNRRIITGWQTPGVTPVPGDVRIAPGIERITPVLAWLTVLVEGAVAVSFLAPLPARLRAWRDGSMLAFVVATYPLAPVTGFGRLLLAMSAMQSELPHRLRLSAYVGTFSLVSLLSHRSFAINLLADWLG